MRTLAAALAIAALLGAGLAGPAGARAASAGEEAEAKAKAKVTQSEALTEASKDPNVEKERQLHPDLSGSVNWVEGHWEVAWFAEGKELALVLVDPDSGEVKESWTGYQVAWKMARGYSGQFGHTLNAPYVFLPLCAIFLVGLFDWRRWRRVANLDLLVLLAFGVSHFFFNRGEIGVSVPLYYPVLLYLLGRALWIGFRGRGEGLRPSWPAVWLLIAALFLMGFRVGLNIADSGTADIGYASIVGADRIAHGEAVYGNFPSDIPEGDTYGPVSYFAYVPFERIWPWSGVWDDVDGAHAAAVSFDIATFALLILLGLRIRPGPEGRRLAATLAFGWAAYPYTAMVLESNSNDGLVAMLMVALLVWLARPALRGALASLAAFAKFAPAVLAPMLLTYRGEEEQRSPLRSAVLFAGAFVAFGVLAMLWPAIDPGLRTFYDRTLGFQVDRHSPFSIWGQVPSLDWLRDALLLATAALSIALAFVPRRKSLVQVAALSAAAILALQITMKHWFYLYIPWFYPLLLVALATLAVRREEAPGPSAEQSSPPALVG
ncbi:MAG TPA: glycosyltransferase 87 family protein [Solirubrobacterales bacterium]|nr:glycosyltransferase 87 family protein [Solirubrobacterales bacterium]